jgi:hypothetical protein
VVEETTSEQMAVMVTIRSIGRWRGGRILVFF